MKKKERQRSRLIHNTDGSITSPPTSPPSDDEPGEVVVAGTFNIARVGLRSDR